MIATIEHKPWTVGHAVYLEGIEVASYKTRASALKLVNKLLQADFARLDYSRDGILSGVR
jgi:hypothetical protein